MPWIVRGARWSSDPQGLRSGLREIGDFCADRATVRGFARHVITGPAALSYAAAAGMISAATGRRLQHRSVSTSEMAARFTGIGLPPDYAAFLADLDEKIRHGAENRVTATVAEVTGSPARSFAEFVDTHGAAFLP